MASNNFKLQNKNLPKIESDVYAKVPANHLLVFAVYTLQEQSVTASVEEIISVCFRLFPHSFSLKSYTRWPDSALVIRRLNDGREKGNIKGNAAEGFLLKYKGKQLAKRIARKLGLAKKQTVPAKKKIVVIKPVKAQVTKASVVPQKKKPIAMVVKKKMPKKQLSKSVKKIIQKPITSSKQKVEKKSAAAKAGIPPSIKVQPKPAKKLFKLPVPVKKTPNKKKARKVIIVRKTQPTQLTLTLPPIQEKKASQPKKIVKAAILQAPIQVSKEEKAKAGKVIQLMERSDAYRLYRKNGDKSKISEFDFRNMLFTTMESSAETLTRNVELFKRYAGIHQRTDLLVFLDFCKSSFAPLLKQQAKQLVKKKRS